MLITELQFKDELLKTIIDNAFHCVVVVDINGFITYLNQAYCDFIKVDQHESIGRHVTDVIENTRMHIVARTGKEEIADLQFIEGNYMIADRLPIRQGGMVVGAVGTVTFRDTEEWRTMNSHIKNLLTELEYYRSVQEENTGAKYSLHDIVGSSSEIKVLKERIKKVAASDVSVLIRGESGTGKELFAHSIHQLSERSNKSFIKVNCGAIPEHLLESELFGYEEGAFTGAKKGGKPGKFQLADGGTILLDEIGDMPLHMQVKLLRVLQDREVEAVGSVKPVKVDVRVIAATNKPLEKMVEEQRFREDLFYRINVIQVNIPPLRDRPEDIKELSGHFLAKINKRSGRRILGLQEDVASLLDRHNWPGNARELENVIEAAIHLCQGERITKEALPDYLKEVSVLSLGKRSLKEIMEETEKRVLQAALREHHGDRLKTAHTLGIGKTSLYDKLKKYGVE
ncbi:sigma-54 interaction domain-containing protein [Fictibacillus fluitans]|uniref:Sigma 54-interacting transcriptional regulator n=1 Tax=Fictibacillus fluitans TaxID=3058422 RepID=A0ABT8HZB3_9BACL|nr:sigma 54-interacting transcriptional regulator [Fictibacillus sp. NE201]MDN4525602.1 sigma 54-interacting transcriptional regulator [Fictibacillus sp. NE201]